MVIQGKYLYYGDDLSEVYHIRTEVFCKEMGIREQDVNDNLDLHSVHVLIYSCDDTLKPVATGRITFDGNTYIITNVCVLKEERNKYYGDFAVRMLGNKGFLSGANEIIAETFTGNIEFYEKIGFVISGSSYENIGGEYIRLMLNSENLCKKCNK